MRTLAFVASFALLTACGGGAKNLCQTKNIKCESPLICDGDDGICKCGGRGGVICPSMFTCDSANNTCLSTRCVGVDCTGKSGTSCDVFDGVCKCGGTGGMACMANESCDPAAKRCLPTVNCNDRACNANQSCDTVTGLCRCGTNMCLDNQFCSPEQGSTPKMCTTDICNGVHCAGGNTCDKNDGYCKCNNVVCQSGEACSCGLADGGTGLPADGGTCAETARSCRPGSACLGVVCNGGTLCDPVDGQCKCGGPGGPACASNQICALGPPPQCQGGAQCVLLDGGMKICNGGTSCDPEDGKCKCGGRGGTVCSAGDGGSASPSEVCVSTALQQSCRRPCDVRTPDCVAGQQCYFDSSAATPTAYCAVPTGAQAEDQACQTATACFAGNPMRAMHCNGLALGQTGICRPYCDVNAGMSGCLQVPRAQTCQQIGMAPMNFGYCLSQ